MGHQRCRCNQHLYCPMASIPPKARKPFLRRISHRRWIRHVCLPLQTKRRSHRCHGNHLHQPTQTSTDSQPNFNLLKLTWYLLKTAKLTGDHAESPTVCNASEETASTADAWVIPAVHLSSLTQMMVSLTWLETPPSEPQTAPLPPQECGPRTLLSRTGSTASSLPNFSLSNVVIFSYSICFMNKI